MKKWREEAERQNWSRINPFSIPERERSELLDVVSNFVPKRTYGDGIETYEDFIHWREGTSQPQRGAALLLWRLRTLMERPKVADELFAEALDLAKNALERAGIRYEGLRTTYFYWHPTKRKWKQVSRRRGQIIINRALRIDVVGLEMAIAWRDRHPWRSLKTLMRMYREHFFEPKTPAWHALQVLIAYHEFYEVLQDRIADGRFSARRLPTHLRPHNVLSRRRDGDFVLDHVAEASYVIGRSHEALAKKPYEVHALRGLATLQSAHKGGTARRARTSSDLMKRHEFMHRKISEGHTIRRAAQLAVKSGYAPKEDTARQSYWRSQKKL